LSLDYEGLFERMCAESLNGVPGVWRIRKGNPTSTQCVLIGSHGNEIFSGLSIVEYLLAEEPHESFQDDVDFIIAIGNIDAARMAIEAGPDNCAQYRFTPGGRDMNRMPAFAGDLVRSDTAEARRAMDLREVLLPLKLEYVLDVHSTDTPSTPACLGIVGPAKETVLLVRQMSKAVSLLTDVVPVQSTFGTKTQTLSSILEPRLSIEVEVGQTGTEEAEEVAVTMFVHWCNAIGISRTFKPFEMYQAVGSVMAPDISYFVVDKRLLEDHAVVKEGDVLLRNAAGDTVVAPCDGELVWGPSNTFLTPTNVASEIFFIVKRL
jgi:hypothetical protein